MIRSIAKKSEVSDRQSAITASCSSPRAADSRLANLHTRRSTPVRVNSSAAAVLPVFVSSIPSPIVGGSEFSDAGRKGQELYHFEPCTRLNNWV